MTQRVAAMVGALAVSFGATAQSSCGAPTPRDMEGPFYKAGAPRKASLSEPGTNGERLVLSGVVQTRDCKPVANARLDFWQADERGEYDNAGFRYRGQVVADASGRYRLETILPGKYPGRPRHIHVKVQTAAGGGVLTTQLYFGDERARALAPRTESREGALHASFDFVIQ